MKVVIIGKGLMLANLILGAKDAGAEIVGVFHYDCTIRPYIKTEIGRFFNPAPEFSLIKQLKIPLIKFKSVNSEEFRKLLIKENIDIMLVGTWKERIKKEIYDIPKIATINVHPSMLPKDRGPNPYLQAILHGETSSGVTLHLTDENFDTGAILAQAPVNIDKNDTSKELREKTVRVARKLTAETLLSLEKNMLIPKPQNEKYSSYFPNITGDEKMLDFNKMTAEEIFRTVKALHPFLPCYVTYKNMFFVTDPYNTEILENRTPGTPGDIIAKDTKTKTLEIVCKDGKIIRFSNLKLYGLSIFTGLYIKHKIKTAF